MANLDNYKGHPLKRIGFLLKSVVLKVDGFEIGVIGYLTNDTKKRTDTRDVDFNYEVDAIK